MVEKEELIYEGKAKKLYRTSDEEVIWVTYKDSATAFNGVKKAEISGKGHLNNEITSLLFSKLSDAGIENHFIEKISDNEQLVKRVKIIPLEVVTRNIVAGSLSKRLGLEEGIPLEKTLIEFYYKNDELGDPLFTEDHIQVLQLATPEQLVQVKRMALQVNEFLSHFFETCNLKLVDFKLEFGIDQHGALLLADEISPDNCRLWDADTNKRLDKDVFRRDLGNLTDAYEEILERLGGK